MQQCFCQGEVTFYFQLQLYKEDIPSCPACCMFQYNSNKTCVNMICRSQDCWPSLGKLGKSSYAWHPGWSQDLSCCAIQVVLAPHKHHNVGRFYDQPTMPWLHLFSFCHGMKAKVYRAPYSFHCLSSWNTYIQVPSRWCHPSHWNPQASILSA